MLSTEGSIIGIMVMSCTAPPVGVAAPGLLARFGHRWTVSDFSFSIHQSVILGGA